MARDNDNLRRLFADKTVSKANKAKRLSRAIETCKGRVSFLKKEIAQRQTELKDVLRREAIALDLLGQLDRSTYGKQVPTEPVRAEAAGTPMYDSKVVRDQFGEIEIFDGLAISIGKFTSRRREQDGRVWVSPLSATGARSGTGTGTVSKPADLGSEHAARALECPGYLHAMILVKTQMSDPSVLDKIQSACARAKVGPLPLANAFANQTFDGVVAQRLNSPRTRDAELSWLNSAPSRDKRKS